MKSVTLKVGGMHCPGCVMNVKQTLLSTQGVVRADVDIENDTATIQYNDPNISVDDLVSKVENIGFKAKPLNN